MLVGQAITAGATVGASVMLFGFQLVQEDASPSLGLQGILLGGGIAVFVFFDRRERKAAQERNLERREADEAKDDRIKELEDKVDRLTQRIFDMLQERRDR